MGPGLTLDEAVARIDPWQDRIDLVVENEIALIRHDRQNRVPESLVIADYSHQQGLAGNTHGHQNFAFL